MKGLTPKQQELLTFIEAFIRANHYAPSYQEIMEHFGFKSPGTVYKYIQILIQKGALNSEKRGHRSVNPVQTIQPHLGQGELKLPLIANLTAGYPLELFVKSQMIAVPSSLVQEPDHTYIFQAQGDSLQEEWILDGDFLMIESRQEIQPGEMILGLINQHEAILKRYFPEGHYIRLESQNTKIPPRTVKTEHMSIQGVLTGVMRVY